MSIILWLIMVLWGGSLLALLAAFFVVHRREASALKRHDGEGLSPAGEDSPPPPHDIG